MSKAPSGNRLIAEGVVDLLDAAAKDRDRHTIQVLRAAMEVDGCLTVSGGMSGSERERG